MSYTVQDLPDESKDASPTIIPELMTCQLLMEAVIRSTGVPGSITLEVSMDEVGQISFSMTRSTVLPPSGRPL